MSCMSMSNVLVRKNFHGRQIFALKRTTWKQVLGTKLSSIFASRWTGYAHTHTDTHTHTLKDTHPPRYSRIGEFQRSKSSLSAVNPVAMIKLFSLCNPVERIFVGIYILEQEMLQIK